MGTSEYSVHHPQKTTGIFPSIHPSQKPGQLIREYSGQFRQARKTPYQWRFSLKQQYLAVYSTDFS
jgi:hypothetical protein